MGDAVVSWSTV